MTPSLYSPTGVLALNRLLDKPALMAFDFDGTLAPLCSDPEHARIRVSWSARLKRINRRWPLAVISGRKLDDLTERLGFEPAFIAGNHGAESVAAPCANTATRILDCARSALSGEIAAIGRLGIEVEDKGLSLAVHYRRSSRTVDAATFVARLLDRLPPAIAVSHGRAVFNITVRAAPDKGDALLSAMHSCGVAHALYVGDDVNDEPAFSAAPANSVTVRIGSRHLPTHARFALANHGQMDRLLRSLAKRCH